MNNNEIFFAEFFCGLQKPQVTRVVRLREKRSTGAQFQRSTFLSPANKIPGVTPQWPLNSFSPNFLQGPDKPTVRSLVKETHLSSDSQIKPNKFSTIEQRASLQGVSITPLPRLQHRVSARYGWPIGIMTRNQQRMTQHAAFLMLRFVVVNRQTWGRLLVTRLSFLLTQHQCRNWRRECSIQENFCPEQMFLLVRMQLRSHVDTQPARRLKDYSIYLRY